MKQCVMTAAVVQTDRQSDHHGVLADVTTTSPSPSSPLPSVLLSNAICSQFVLCLSTC